VGAELSSEEVKVGSNGSILTAENNELLGYWSKTEGLVEN
jgi:hypothetical protein